MRKTEHVQIEGNAKIRTVVVQEVTLGDLLDLLDQMDAVQVKGGEVAHLMETLENWLPRLTTLKLEDLRHMTGSELKQVLDGARKVNADFFELARTAGLEGLIPILANALVTDCAPILRGLQLAATPPPGLTAGAGSSPALMPNESEEPSE